MEKIYSLYKIDDIASEFISLAGERRVFAFYGAMGAGKTTLIKSICRHLGVVDNVNSPTFAIINVYETLNGEPIYHMDCYRIDNLRDAENLDLASYFYSGNWCFIEWPENIIDFLPDDCVAVKIDVEGQDKRKITTF